MIKEELKSIEEIFFSEEFEHLCEYKNRFDLFKVMRIQNKELVHSNLVAELLDPNGSHRMGHLFLNAFVKEIGRKRVARDQYKNNQLTISTLTSILDAKAVIFRELHRIDIIVIFPEQKIVLGIENKIWSAEGEEQISRYQKILKAKYPDHTSAIIFLTPSGKAPQTDEPNTGIPVYCLSYQSIADIINKIKNNASATVYYFLEQFVNHLEEYMAGNDEVRNLCWELFKKNRDAYEAMAKNIGYCKVKEYFESLRDSIERKYQPNIKFELHQKENHFDLDIRMEEWPEGIWIKIYKHSWFGIFPFTKNSATVDNHFGTNKATTVNSWGDGYYYFWDKNLDSERWINKDGDSMTATDIDTAMNKLDKFIEGINSKINAQLPSVTASTPGDDTKR